MVSSIRLLKEASVDRMPSRSSSTRLLPLLWLSMALLCGVRPAISAEPSPAGVEFFEKQVRPVLVEHCFSCHGSAGKAPGARAERGRGGLRLSSRADLLK